MQSAIFAGRTHTMCRGYFLAPDAVEPFVERFSLRLADQFITSDIILAHYLLQGKVKVVRHALIQAL